MNTLCTCNIHMFQHYHSISWLNWIKTTYIIEYLLKFKCYILSLWVSLHSAYFCWSPAGKKVVNGLGRTTVWETLYPGRVAYPGEEYSLLYAQLSNGHVG